PHPQPQPPPPQYEDLIDLSSSSEDGNQPPPPKFRIPKTEEAEEAQHAEEAQPQQSQTVVEVVNILPTQEVIDLSSSLEEDRKQPMVPKEEQDDDNSPHSQIISSVLVSIRRDHQPIGTPSFDLGVEPPLLTPQTMDAIDEIDDKLKKNPELDTRPFGNG
ncbi:hypothetical protein PIB30_044858, partial [Stylosanthes scabra]|nr:hypothetical protein [Stylosanthes scabra]